jgi:hypothetical protein
VEICIIADNTESMCKSGGDKELVMILAGQLRCVPLTVCWGEWSDINGYIKNGSI